MIAPRAQPRRFDDLAPWISTVARLVVGGVLLVAGALKVIDPRSSVAAVRAYEMVPTWLERPIGWGLPFLEVGLGLLLVAGLFTRIAAAVSGLLFIAFLIAVVSAAVQAYQLVPGWLDRPIGWGLPFLEAGLGLLLVAGLFTRTAAAISGLLFVVFLIAAVSAAARGLSIDCGCFGGGGEVAPGQSAYAEEIVRDLALLALCGWLVWQPRSRFALDHPDLTGAGAPARETKR